MTTSLSEYWHMRHSFGNTNRGANLWAYFAQGCMPPFRLVKELDPDPNAFTHVVVDANHTLCMYTDDEEGPVVIEDWNTNHALYAMTINTEAWKEVTKTI